MNIACFYPLSLVLLPEPHIGKERMDNCDRTMLACEDLTIPLSHAFETGRGFGLFAMASTTE